MANFSGLLQADGYSGFGRLYDPARTKPGPITEVACWAHARRGFFDEWEHHNSLTAKAALDRIAAIYAVEARPAFAPVEEREELRRETAPLVDAFFGWAEATVAKLSVKSSLAGAFSYAIKRRVALSRFITDGRLEVDNNIAENGTRCIALGRKNFLFAGSDTGGDRAASIYTIVQTAKLNGVNPEAYLRDTLTRIADGHPINRLEALMPWKMVLAKGAA
jgi:transposase